MSDRAAGLSLLEELDARQDELLDELDRLNRRIEQVIAEWTTSAPHLAPGTLPAAA